MKEVERINKHGFSLTEVIVSALILALTAGGVLYMFSTEKGIAARSGRQIRAMDFTRQTLEELRNAVGADTWPATGNLSAGAHTTEAFLSLAGTELGDTFGGSREYQVADIDPDSSGGAPDYKSVTVTVNWTEPAESE